MDTNSLLLACLVAEATQFMVETGVFKDSILQSWYQESWSESDGFFRKQYYSNVSFLDALFRQIIRTFITIGVSQIIGSMVSKSLKRHTASSVFLAEIISYALASVVIGIVIRSYKLESLLYGELQYATHVYSQMNEPQRRWYDLKSSVNVYAAYMVMNFEAYSTLFGGMAFARSS